MSRRTRPRFDRDAAAITIALALATVTSSFELLRIPLENFDQMQFIGSIDVGSPPQRFRVIFDTGSSDLWLPETNCIACAGSSRYHAAASHSHEALNESFRLAYGSGNASGYVMREQLSLLGSDTASKSLTLSRVRMGSAGKTTERLQHFKADGIVGLGLEALAQITKPSLLNLDPRLKLFSIYINPMPGMLPSAQLIVGGVDDTLPIAHLPQSSRLQVTWHHFPLVRYPSTQRAHGFWSVQLHQFAVESLGSSVDAISMHRSSRTREEVVVISAAVAIVDSGTSLILLPRRAYEATIAQIQQHLREQHDRELCTDPRAVSSCSCVGCTAEMFPALRFTFVVEGASSEKEPKSQTLALQGTDYVRCEDLVCTPQLGEHELSTATESKEQAPSSASTVVSNVLQEDEQEQVVVLGAAFLRAYYVQFNAVRETVGFACVETPSSSIEGATSVCSGGWAPKLQFRSTRFANAEISWWRPGSVLWYQMYLGIGVLLFIAAFALLWLTFTVSSCDLGKTLDYFHAWSSSYSRLQEQQMVRSALVSSFCGCHQTQVLESGLADDDGCGCIDVNNNVSETLNLESKTLRTTPVPTSRRTSLSINVDTGS
uniref:Peptidase A1 domain-containing protein n=1 Tax=Peronospora matthiolae TaxID=2874970 RepID=A0AAV1U098_9STRA